MPLPDSDALRPDVAIQPLQAKRESWSHMDRIGPWDRRDAYQVQLDVPSHLTMDVTGQRLPLQWTLSDSNGRVIAQKLAMDQAGSLWTGDLPAGNYHVTLSAWLPLTTHYRFSVDVSEIEQPAAPPASVGSTPPTTPPVLPDVTAKPPVTNFPDVADYGTSQDWNLNSINAPEAWAQGFFGQGVVVAVIDTGVDWSHVDLQGAIWSNLDEVAQDGIDNDRNGFVDDVRGWDFVNGDNNPQDGNGHGTHVAGSIVASRNDRGVTGVAYQADVMPIRVLGNDGSGSDWGVAQGIRYAVDNGADVINLSLGSSAASSLIASALAYAASKEVLVVAAAGNEAAAAPSFPARFSNTYANVVSVGAYDRNSRAASFSNGSGSLGAVQIAAPGVDITSTLPQGQYGRLSGTSMAAPQVAGLAALMLSANPELSAAQLRDLLAQGASRSINGVRAVGSGVNAARSVADARNTVAAAAATRISSATDNGLSRSIPTARYNAALDTAVAMQAASAALRSLGGSEMHSLKGAGASRDLHQLAIDTIFGQHRM